MTKQRDLKAQARARAEKTGESYTAAKAKLLEGKVPKRHQLELASRLYDIGCEYAGKGPWGDQPSEARCWRHPETLQLFSLNEAHEVLCDSTYPYMKCWLAKGHPGDHEVPKHKGNRIGVYPRVLLEKMCPHDDCVLPKGHRSDEHGDDHQQADGTWWNVGQTLPKAEAEGEAIVASATRELIDILGASRVVPGVGKADGPVEQGFAALNMGQIRSPTHYTAPPKCERCGTLMEDGGSVGFYCPVKTCLPAPPKPNATDLMKKAFAAWGITVHPDGKLVAPDGRELKAKWTPESTENVIQDLKTFHGLDGELELARAMMDAVFVSLFGKDAEKPKQPELLWKGMGTGHAVWVSDFDRKLMMDSLEFALTPEERARQAHGPAPSELWKRHELSDEEKAKLAEASAKEPDCTCGPAWGANADCLFHHPPIVDTVALAMGVPAKPPESIDVAQKLVDRLIEDQASGFEARHLVTVDTTGMTPEETTKVLAGMKTRFSEQARCTNGRCGRIYHLDPHRSRVCEHCGHAPVEVIAPGARIFMTKAGFLTAKEPTAQELCSDDPNHEEDTACSCGGDGDDPNCLFHHPLTSPESALFERCTSRSSVTDQRCTLSDGHAADSATRFHRFGAPVELGPNDAGFAERFVAVQPIPPETGAIFGTEREMLRGRPEHATHLDDANFFGPEAVAALPPVPVKDLVPMLEALKYINGGDAHPDEARAEAREVLEDFDKKHPRVLTALHDPRDDEDYEEPEPDALPGETDDERYARIRERVAMAPAETYACGHRIAVYPDLSPELMERERLFHLEGRCAQGLIHRSLKLEETVVIVNGMSVITAARVLDYRAVVALAGYDPERILSVTYRTKTGGGWRSDGLSRAQGTLSRGQSVEVSPGMVFNVADTSSA